MAASEEAGSPAKGAKWILWGGDAGMNKRAGVRKPIPGFESNRVATISRALVENSLRMRSMAFLSQIKMSLLLDTLRGNDEPLSYMRQINDSIVTGTDDWLTLPTKISEEARELQQMTLTMERRREELHAFLAEQMQNLRRSEARFQQLFELIPDAVGIHCGDVWDLVNPAMASIFGAASTEELTGTPVLDRVHPDAREKVAQRIRDAVAAGMAAPLMAERFVRLDGSVFWGEVQGQPFVQGGQPSVLVTMRDITVRVEAERENRQLRQAVDQSSEPMIVMSIHGKVEIANRAASDLYGLSPRQLLGCDAAELCGAQCGDDLYREIAARVQKGEVWQGEIKVDTPCGQRILSRRVSPVFDAHGEVDRQICVDRDMTDERRQQQQLEHTQRLESLGVLAGGIAHDFNNILTAIMGNAALGRMKLEDGHPVSTHLTRIEESSHRAADLCRQMLDYSGKGRFVVRPVNLSGMVEEITKLLEVSITRNVMIKFHLAENLPAVEADSSQLQQVIMNLVINASDAIGEKSGVISLSTGMMQTDQAYLQHAYAANEIEPGRFVFLEVADTGCGMSEATQKKLFDPFFTTKFMGRGLGMSAVLGIVRGHHGAIRVYSEEGQGTTFKVLLPASKTTPPEQVENETRGEWRGAGTVLVVDDEETIRETAAMMLEDMGFDTLTAEDGMQGVEIYRAHQDAIVAVLLDMTMPKLDGKGCFRELRRINGDVRVVLSSGYNEQDATNRFAGQGLAGFIQKPYTPEALRAKMREFGDVCRR